MSVSSSIGSVHVRAPGKINVYLGVGGRHDDGYHALATVFQAVSLYEDVIARPASDFSISVSGLDDPDTVPLDDRNLAMRAAKLLAAAADYDGGVALEIRKQVPVAGGMGGGSADAAAALVAGAAVAGIAAGALLLAPDDAGREPQPTETPTQIAPTSRPLTYADGATIHYGDRTVDAGGRVVELDLTDWGVAFRTADGRIGFTDGSSVDELGELGEPGPASVVSARGWHRVAGSGTLAT